jgi:peptidoglycan/xylan/chitin deacetylase (PgdA/CDA1 family)
MTKRYLFALLFATRLTRLVTWLNRKKVTILCYHSVTKQADAYPNDTHKLHLPIDSFLQHLNYLQAHHRIISLAEFVTARRENIKLPSGAIILTFDDGFRNFLTVVAPLLVERGIPATSFIVTGESFTHHGADTNPDWHPKDDDSHLSWKEVRQLAEQGLEFGSHTCSHAVLPDISPAHARRELEDSLSALKTCLGPNSFPLSYPHGRSSEEISRLSQSLGYSCAVTTVLGQNDSECDLFALRRTVIASDDDLPTFAARVAGITSWYSRAAGLFNIRPKEDSTPAALGYDSMIVEE